MLSQVIVFVDLWALSQPGWILAGVKSLTFLIYFTMIVSFYMVYHDRTERRRAAKQAPATS